MSRPFEREIQIVWKNRGSPEAAGEVLLKRWAAGGLSPDEVATVGFFLLRIGMAADVLRRLAAMCREGAQIPWELVAETMTVLKSAPSKILLDQILVGASLDDALVALTRSKGLDRWEPRLPRLRERAEPVRAQALEDQKNQMLSQLKILQNDRLFQEEEELLERIARTFPEDRTVHERFRLVAERRARSLIDSRRNAGQNLGIHLEKKSLEDVPADIRLALTELAPELLDRAQTHPETAYDIAVSLLLMDFPEEARQILQQAPPSDSVAWLELELLVETGRHLEALDLCEGLERKFAGDSDAIFSITYARSRALWGLGKAPEAISLLQSILRLRPHYRSARSLFMHWKEKLP